MLARTLLTIIVVVASLIALGAFGMIVVDFVKNGFRLSRMLGMGAIVVAALVVLRWCATALSGSRTIKSA